MALIPFSQFVKENEFGFTSSSLKHLIRTNPSIHKALKRISPRSLFIDEDALQEWISEQKYFVMKLDRKKPKV